VTRPPIRFTADEASALTAELAAADASTPTAARQDTKATASWNRPDR
jgi:predicted DNA-binding transcriptional regulator YafY